MLKARNAARAPGAKVVNVVDRQAVAVLSRGTLMDPEMVAAHPDAAYVLAGGERHWCHTALWPCPSPRWRES
jgi:DNA mismatch repair protein MSH6